MLRSSARTHILFRGDPVGGDAIMAAAEVKEELEGGVGNQLQDLASNAAAGRPSTGRSTFACGVP